MAKKGNRQLLVLQCTVCKSKNYISSRNNNNTKDKLALNKYCKVCRKSTPHKEVKAS